MSNADARERAGLALHALEKKTLQAWRFIRDRRWADDDCLEIERLAKEATEHLDGHVSMLHRDFEGSPLEDGPSLTEVFLAWERKAKEK